MNPTMDEILAVANSVPMWIMALLVVGIVAFQAVMFMGLVRKFSARTGVMTPAEMTKAFRTGVISCIGPAAGVFIVSVGLITRVGGPVTFMRVGVIGSAGYELMAATFGAEAYGVTLGGPGYNFQAFTTAVWTMALGGCGWLVFTALFNKSLAGIAKKATAGDPNLFGIVGLAASLGAFSYLIGGQIRIGTGNQICLLASGAAMYVILQIAKAPGMAWLREWSLGFSMVIGMAVATMAVG